MVWAVNGTQTATGSPTTYTISGMEKTTFVQILNNDFIDPITIPRWQMGDGGIETGSVYTWRRSYNGNTDGISVNQTEMDLIGNSECDNFFAMAYMINISAEEKLLLHSSMNHNNNGAGNAPFRAEIVFKIVFTGQVDEIKMTNSNTDTYDANSNISVLGTD